MTETQETQIQEYSQTAAALSMLREKYSDATYDVATTDGMVAAKSGRSEVRGYRTSLEKMRKEIKSPALERCRLIDSEATRITTELVALEKPIDRQIKAHEAKLETERQAKIEAETKRVEDIQQRIADIREYAAFQVSITKANIEQSITDIEAVDVDESFDEFTIQAQDAKQGTLAKLRELLEAAIEREAEAARIEAEREELAKLRADQDKRIAEEQAKREAAEAEASKKLEAEQKAERDKLEKQRKAQEKAQAKIDAENKRLADAKAARQRIEQKNKVAQAKARADAKKAEFPGKQVIIEALCEHFDVTETVVNKWLKVLN